MLALVVAVAVTACGDDAEPASLEGTSWILVAGVDVPADIAVSEPTVAFTSDTITGSGGCNRYSGGYETDGDSIEIGMIASTQMACPAPAGTIEAAFFDALQQTTSWSIEDDQLVLSDANDDELLRLDSAPTS
jgi:heat shock protein HslJ